MKKLLKIAAALAAVFLVLLLGAAVAIRAYFPPAKIKALVIEQAEKSLHRKVAVAEVGFGLLRGLRIEGVRISEKPDFSKGDFLKARAFTFRFSWLPLLKKRLVANEVTLDGLEVVVKKHKDGTTNLPGTTSPPQPSSRKQEEGDAGSPAIGLAGLSVETIRLKDANVRYIDEAAKSEAVVRVPLAAIRRFTLSGAFPYSAKIDLAYRSGKESRSAVVELDGTMDLASLDQAKMQGELKKLSIRTGGAAVTGALKFQNASAPSLEGEFQTPALDSKTLAALAPGAFPEGLRLPAARFSFSAESRPPALSIPSFRLEAAGMTVTGKLSVPDVNAKTPRLTLEAGSNSFDLSGPADILPMTRGKGLSGKASFKAAAKGPVDALDVPVLELHLELDALSPEALLALLPIEKGKSPLPAGIGLPASRLDLSASKSGNRVDLKNVTVSAGDMRARISGRVEAVDSKDPSLRLTLDTDSIAFTSFASFLPGITNLQGKAQLHAAVTGTSTEPKVSGTLDLNDAGAQYMKQKLEHFTGTVRFSETSVEIPKLTGRVNGGELSLKFSAADPKAPTVTLHGSLSVLDAGALEALMATAPGETAAKPFDSPQGKPAPYTGPVMRTSGAFTIEKITHPNFNSGKAVLEWDLKGVTPEFKLLDGTAKLRVGSGKAVKILEVAKNKGGMARALVVPLEILDKARGKIPGLSIPSLEEIPFDRIEGDYAFKKGVMSMQPSLLEGPVVTAETRGTVDLPGQTVDLRSALKATSLGNLALLVTGPMDDPKIQPDLAKVKEKVAEKGTEILKKQGEKLLRGLFNK